MLSRPALLNTQKRLKESYEESLGIIGWSEKRAACLVFHDQYDRATADESTQQKGARLKEGTLIHLCAAATL